MIMIICIIVAVIVIIALVGMNIRSFSSPSEKTVANVSSETKKEKKEDESQVKTAIDLTNSTDISEPLVKKEEISNTFSSMNDQAYRQALRTFADKKDQSVQNQIENNESMKDDEFRKALRSMKQK